METTKIILASKSPRRKELLSLLNLQFDVVVSEIEERIDYQNDLRKEIEKLSFQKAEAVFKNHQDALVIGSDTIVKIGNKVLGKPHSKQEAKEMLELLSNKEHEVVTAVTILYKDVVDIFSSVAKVKFVELTQEEIIKYLETEEPLDKAGAYAIQGYAARFIESIDGDYYTIVGLPIALLYKHLKKYLQF